MIKILKQVKEYTFLDFADYCKNNGLSFAEYRSQFYNWAINQHETDLLYFIERVGEDTVVTVNGTVYLDSVGHRVKPKTLPFLTAMDAMLTSDIQDYSILLSPCGTYYVITTHARGRNVFKFRLDDKK